MEILFLNITVSHYFSGIKDKPVIQEIVSSPELAAILLWKKQQSVSYPEPEHYTGHLYEIDLGKMTIEEIEIPNISFSFRGEI